MTEEKKKIDEIKTELYSRGHKGFFNRRKELKRKKVNLDNS
jgi:hypothetical protein